MAQHLLQRGQQLASLFITLLANFGIDDDDLFAAAAGQAQHQPVEPISLGGHLISVGPGTIFECAFG